MGSFFIVVATPGLDLLPRILDRHEPVLVEALGPQPAVERFDQPVICRFSAPAEVQANLVRVRPLVEHSARELAAVVHADLSRKASVERDTIQDRRHSLARQSLIEVDRQTLTSKVIDQRQQPGLASVEQLDEDLDDEGIEMIAPHRSNRKPENVTQDGRKLRRYTRRWTVERTISWFQNFRRLCIRYEKSTMLFQGFLNLGCSIILLKQVLG